jgi:hypothetical protein
MGCVVYTSTHCGTATSSHYHGTRKDPFGTSPFLSAINVALDKTLPTNLELVKEVDYLVRCYYAQMFALMVKIMSEETFEQSTCLFCNQLHVHEKFMALSPDLCELIIVFWLSFLIC